MDMATITEITAQRKKNGRVNLFLDGRYYCSLEYITVLANGLKAGDDIDEEQLIAIQKKSESSYMFERCVKYISRRIRTEKEMAAYLKDKGCLPEIILDVTEKLKDYGYIDDEKFATLYMREYKKKFGDKRIKSELKRLGVDEEIISNTIEDGGGDRVDDAKRIAEKYLRSHKKTDKNKLYNYLYGKGFSYSEIREAAEGFDFSANIDNTEDEDYE